MAGTSMDSGRNTRTALVLAALALAFFFAIMFKYWLAQ